MSNHKTILLDVDGVLADFVGAVLKLVNKPKVKINRWDFHEQICMTANELWATIDLVGHDFWANIPMLPWVNKLIDVVYRHGMVDNTLLCTSPSLSDECNSGKIAWIRKNLPGFSRRFMVTPCKHLLRGDFILVDDSDENCERFWEIKQEAILFPQPWNKNRKHCDNRLQYVENELDLILKRS
jgi:5'(3')-deoxyribonucleotidase